MRKHASIDQQIAVLKTREVTFDEMREEDARHYLLYNSYYFKLKAYEQNYQDTLVCPDFAHLVELATIDFSLSRLILNFCLAVEHSMKVRFNRELSNQNDSAMACLCVEAFAERKAKKSYHRGEQQPSHSLEPRHNPYTQDLYDHRDGDYSLWNLWEMMGFSDQIELYRTFCKLTRQKVPHYNLLVTTRLVRNAVSHGNCLLGNVTQTVPHFAKYGRPDSTLVKHAMELSGLPRQSGGKKNSFQSTLNQLVVHNFAAVLICHLEYVESAPMLEYTCRALERLSERIDRNLDSYFGDKDRHEYRNILVYSTLNSLIILAEGYRKRAKEKIARLEVDPQK